ncbi:MAG: hypothetical protein DLM50_03630 [Candidatus Meridianibacter frigidus]|nr:MAG: hypothetical protein DLM50_03630 [Candidatus Eremiobacteraeota bacterium]
MTRFSAVFLFAAALLIMLPADPGRAQVPNAPAKPAPAKEDVTPRPSASPSPSPKPTPAETAGPIYKSMQWREIGPALPGGRLSAVTGSASDPLLYYIGAAGGGVWKSTDGTHTWNAVFEKQSVSAIGALAIDPKDNKTVWVGSGESNPRNDVSYGDGIYKTTDGGNTWKNMGLAKTRHIARILVDPRNSNHVIVAALGDVFGDSTDRGVYVTQDGGATWSKTLYISPISGASDLAMDLQHPEVVYAGMWHFRRQPWTFTSGGLDDGLFRSADGGLTWTRLSGHGLPSGITGRVGLAVAPSNGARVYAMIESADGILWRSDDAGQNWSMVNKDTLVVQRPFYFSRMEIDPKNPDHVFALSAQFSSSRDGGKSFKPSAFAVHGDFHAMWIDPSNPSRMVVGDDGGVHLSLDGGAKWFDGRAIPIGQVYHVAISLKENPYWVCGGWQDNNGWCGPSNSLDPSGIQNKHWRSMTGGDGEWVVPDPVDPSWVWADSQNGSVTVFNKDTKDTIFVQPYIANSLESFDISKSKYRYNWDTPIAFAPWDGHIAWLAGNVVFQSVDRGRHWKAISPDLTLNDKSHQQPTGGPIKKDVSGAENSDTILDIEGSPLRRGEIWVGTDDGFVQVTRDGGKHWKNVTPPSLLPYGRVETTAPSDLDAGTAYVNIDRHRSGDFQPYVFVTRNFGQTWKPISRGLPADQYVRAVRPDLHDRGIVYAGTENGIWISIDGGASWQDFKNNLPTVSVRDIRFQPEWNDLVIATHGRSLYIMDDMRPLQAMRREGASGFMLFAPRTSYEYNLQSDDEGTYTDYVGANPPYGAIITYYLGTPSTVLPKLEILNAAGHPIRTISGSLTVGSKEVPNAPNKAGINRYTWDFGIDGPVRWNGAARDFFKGPQSGPGVPPGRYGVRLTAAGKSATQWFEVKADPKTLISQADLVDAFNFSKRTYREFGVIDAALNTLDGIKKQLDALAADPKVKANAALLAQVQAASATRTDVFKRITADYQNGEDFIQYPGKVREDFVGLLRVGGANARDPRGRRPRRTGVPRRD